MKTYTYEEVYDLALRNYCHGGDVFVECWERSDFDEYVKEFGAMTDTALRNLFNLYESVEAEEDALREWMSGEPNPNPGKVEAEDEAKTHADEMKTKGWLYRRIHELLFDIGMLKEFDNDYDRIMWYISDVELHLDDDTTKMVYDDFKGEFDLWLQTIDSCVPCEETPEESDGISFECEYEDFNPEEFADREAEYFSRYEREYEKDWSPSNPWDAPGMSVSDFITGVYPF